MMKSNVPLYPEALVSVHSSPNGYKYYIESMLLVYCILNSTSFPHFYQQPLVQLIIFCTGNEMSPLRGLSFCFHTLPATVPSPQSSQNDF